MQKPQIHDNTDSDVIVINKSKLENHLHLIQEFYTSSSNAIGLFGVSIALGTTSLITDNFRNLGPIPGETIRAVFIVLAIVAFVLSIRFGLSWHKLKDQHGPKTLVKNLLNNDSRSSKVKSK